MPADPRRDGGGTLTKEHQVLQLRKAVGNQNTLRFIRGSTPARHDDFRGGATNPQAEGSEPRVELPERSFLELSSPSAITLSRMPDTGISRQSNGGCACEKHSGGTPCAQCAKKQDILTSQSKTTDATTDPELSISQPGDRYEREADHVADAVMHLPAQRCDGPQIHRARDGSGARGATAEAKAPYQAPRFSEGSLTGLAGGSNLPSSMRAFFESRFHHDFSRVRVHADSQAAESAREFDAAAYTVGEHIVFGERRYAPETDRGQRLLAHELTHVVQQRLGDTTSQLMEGHEDSEEQQARRTASVSGWGGLHSHYDDVAADKRWHSATRPLPVLPMFTPARARIQRVQLTYDDGPDTAGNTRTVLAALNKAGARATFYLVGKRVAQGDNWRTVFDIAAAGHWIGNHAYDWNDATDNHIFLSGTAEERAEKILQTEWAIRDALIQGRDDAKKNKTWDSIPQANRDYIEDVIAHGTGRFRTPGFRSHLFHRGGMPTTEDATTMAAIESANHVLAAIGLRPLAITQSGGEEGVDIDPEDWRAGRTQSEIESGVKGKLRWNTQSILLHSRIAATAGATPAIVAAIQGGEFKIFGVETGEVGSFDPTPQGASGSIQPKPGFLKMSFSNPPTSSEIVAARAYLKANMLALGPYISGSVALGIFQLAQRAGSTEVNNFISDIKNTTVQTADGLIPMANWLNANEEWRLFAWFLETWTTNKPFPRIKGVTL